MYSSVDAFALLHVAEVEIEASITPWIEVETVPADARIISQTWEKVNKDGSPDRRFADNHQIPVVEYSTLTVTSQNGLNKEYVLSNSGAVAQFVSVWKTFKQVVALATA